MAKKLTDRIAARIGAKKTARGGKNRATFLALRDEIEQALADGWPVKVVWEQLHDEGRIDFGYDAFLHLANRICRPPDAHNEAPQTTNTTTGKPVKEDEPKKPDARLSGFDYKPQPKKEDLI